MLNILIRDTTASSDVAAPAIAALLISDAIDVPDVPEAAFVDVVGIVEVLETTLRVVTVVAAEVLMGIGLAVVGLIDTVDDCFVVVEGLKVVAEVVILIGDFEAVVECVGMAVLFFTPV